MTINTDVPCHVTPRSQVDMQQCFRPSCCVHYQGTDFPWWRRQKEPLKYRDNSATLCGSHSRTQQSPYNMFYRALASNLTLPNDSICSELEGSSGRWPLLEVCQIRIVLLPFPTEAENRTSFRKSMLEKETKIWDNIQNGCQAHLHPNSSTKPCLWKMTLKNRFNDPIRQKMRTREGRK